MTNFIKLNFLDIEKLLPHVRWIDVVFSQHHYSFVRVLNEKIENFRCVSPPVDPILCSKHIIKKKVFFSKNVKDIKDRKLSHYPWSVTRTTHVFHPYNFPVSHLLHLVNQIINTIFLCSLSYFIFYFVTAHSSIS